MKTNKKQPFINVLLILAVFCIGIFNGGRQLDTKVEKLEYTFMNGENDDQLSIHYDLTKIDDSLSYFLSLSKLYNLQKDTNITKLEKLHNQFSTLDTIDDYSEWYDDIKEYYPLAIATLKEQDLTQQHTNMLSKYEATYNSAIHTIAYASFNKDVRAYEEESDGFMADFIKMITNVKEVDTFE